MMQGRIETLEQRHERAQGIENWRLAEQLRAETIFVSYVFHEMRNPTTASPAIYPAWATRSGKRSCV